MNLNNKKIGIWGFGIVGKSAARYFRQHGNPIEILDSQPLSNHDKDWLTSNNIPFYNNNSLQSFLKQNDYIIASPGIDLRSYAHYKHKFITELDIFSHAWEKPIIAVTGSVGKTTITHALSHILNEQQFPVCTGGNIGVGMLDLLNQHNNVYAALLEVSSFQLEHCKTFAPDLAIWTNFYPNHLDRHATLEQYFQAKLPIIIRQKQHQNALLPLEIIDRIAPFSFSLPQNFSFFSLQPPTKKQLQQIKSTDRLFFITDNTIVMQRDTQKIELISYNNLPAKLIHQNWLIICSTLYLLGKSLDTVAASIKNLPPQEHRLEKVATINQVDFYNDSKSTTPQATLAAINQLHNKPIILFLGGLSKGIDRTDLIQNITHKVTMIYCFGQEAKQLKHMCDRHQQQSAYFATLEEAFNACTQTLQPGDQVLFSPAGASFDLFNNYQERGNRFKQLVTKLQINSNKSAR